MLTALTDPFVDDVIKSNPFRNDYEIEGDIGKGNYGCVLRVKKRNTGQYYAIKVTELQCESNNACTIPATTLREINSIRMIKSDHVIEYHGFDKTDRYIFVLTDHANTDLQDYLKSLRAYLPLRKLKNFLYQILSGLTDVHAAGMCHRDVKPANILLYKDARQEFGYTLKLADFGLGRDLVRPVRPTSPCVVTCYYRAPEVFLKQESMCMSSMDVWSVGICMIQMVNNEIPFRVRHESEFIEKIFEMRGTPTHPDIFYGVNPSEWTQYFPTQPKPWNQVLKRNVTPAGEDLLNRLLDLNPVTRISARRAKEHPFFDEVRS